MTRCVLLKHLYVIESFLCVVEYYRPLASCLYYRLLASVSMPATPVSAFGQIVLRAPSDNCTRFFDKWKGEGHKLTWPIDTPQRAVMMRDMARAPHGTSSFLKKPTLTKNPIERSFGVFWALGGRRGGGFWVAL